MPGPLTRLIPGARGPIQGPLTDTKWQPNPTTPIPINNYLAQQALRYQHPALQYVHQGPIIDTAWQPPPQTPPPEPAYIKQQALRYLSPAINPIQGPTVDTTWQPPPQATPEFNHYVLTANWWRFVNPAQGDIQGPVVDTTWQPKPQDQPERIHYTALNILRYLSPALQDIAVVSTVVVPDTFLPAGLPPAYYVIRRTNNQALPDIQGPLIDTTWQPNPVAGPELAHYAALNVLRFQSPARQDIQGPVVDTLWQPNPVAGPELNHYLLGANWWRFVNPAKSDIQGPVIDTAWQPNPQAGPELAHYAALNALRFQSRQQLPIEGVTAVVDIIPVPGLAPPPDSRWWFLGQAGRYRVYTVVVPDGPGPVVTVLVTTVAQADQPEMVCDVTAFLGGMY